MAWTDPRTWTAGEVVQASQLNTHLRDNLLAVPHLLALKTSDQTVSSNTTPQDDTQLFFSVGTNQTWWVYLGLWMIDASASVADVKVGTTAPASTAGQISLSYLDVSAVGGRFLAEPNGGGSSFFGRGGTGEFYAFSGLAITAGTAGTFRVQFAQNTSNASGVTMKAGSFIVGMKLAG